MKVMLCRALLIRMHNLVHVRLYTGIQVELDKLILAILAYPHLT